MAQLNPHNHFRISSPTGVELFYGNVDDFRAKYKLGDEHISKKFLLRWCVKMGLGFDPKIEWNVPKNRADYPPRPKGYRTRRQSFRRATVSDEKQLQGKIRGLQECIRKALENKRGDSQESVRARVASWQQELEALQYTASANDLKLRVFPEDFTQ
jgi:hypothetical protein